MIHKIRMKCLTVYTNVIKSIYAAIKRGFLKNKDFSIISKNCVGGIIYERMHLPFLSPTVGLSIPSPDFIKLCENLPYYMSLRPVEVQDDSVPYPVGMLDDVRLEFVHYPSFEAACEKWERRKKRINYNNLCICMTERPDCTEELRQRFEALPYKRKVWFTHLPCKHNTGEYIYIPRAMRKRDWETCWKTKVS